MKKVNHFEATAAMALDMLAKSSTRKIYNLAAGDPDTDVCDALKNAFVTTDLTRTHNYGNSQGNPALRSRIWNDPDEVILANGSKQMVFMALRAVTQPGDKVVIVGPCWASYLKMCDILGIRTELVIGKEENGYVPDDARIYAAVDRGTAAVILNNPNNPTGAVYDALSWADGIMERLQEDAPWIIADEIYRHITDRKFVSLRGKENAIVIDGFSKSYNITGWRLGYAIAPKEVIRTMAALQSQMSGPPSTPVQDIMLRALDEAEITDYGIYRERIDILCEIPKFARFRPAGTFYFYLPIDEKWESSMTLCRYLLEKYGIAVTPGEEYGVERTVRVSVAHVPAEELRMIREGLKEI